MPGGQTTSTGTDNLAAIRAAILDIALNKSGLVWWGHSAGDLPEHTQVQGFPYLAVDNGKQVGSVVEGRKVRGYLARQPEQSEPLFDVKVHAFFPFHPGDTRTYTTADTYRQVLVQAFTTYWTGENSAQATEIADVFMGAWQLRPFSPKYYAVTLTIEAIDYLPVNYS